MVQIREKILGPYHFDGILQRLALDPLNYVDLNNREIKIPVYLQQANVAVSVKAIGTMEQPEFLLTFAEKEGVPAEAVKQEVERLFQWNTNMDEVHQHFLNTDLAPIFENHKGTPLVLDFGLYSCIIKCIIHQQLNMNFAFTLTKRFVETYGEKIDGVLFYPSPETVANIQVEELRELQFSTRKAEYVIEVSKLITSGELDLYKLQDKNDEEIVNTLIKIRGIGKWTAENFLLFGLGRPNLFPVADIGLQNALKQLYNMDRKPTYEEMDRWKEAWNPYMTYASLYLWRSIESGTIKKKAASQKN
ncbi:DNA-3-methyladenine glycosylase II [Bacillus oleivorans]|uniref:DNA-3-methyladenine glycosylase II n=1 Tax=Bacillus oleivorans TaxID=1448271 RepID=A0A285CS18_9BACI|nr:DNA-3-methyladenine glycosylase [Bacillus oleivorans]SNX70379.1 DNA-3-methyladenine glycosylase II [Bacillus oleivorans]